MSWPIGPATSKAPAKPAAPPEISKAVGLHPNYAMNLFKKAFGTTLIDYITHHRVSHVQRLLATTDKKIVDIAFSSGFNSMSRFNEAFREARDEFQEILASNMLKAERHIAERLDQADKSDRRALIRNAIKVRRDKMSVLEDLSEEQRRELQVHALRAIIERSKGGGNRS